MNWGRTHRRVQLSFNLVIDARRLPLEREGLMLTPRYIGAPKKTVLLLILKKCIFAVLP